MGWATVTMAGDAEERAVVTASMNAIGQGIMAGTQVVQYAATDAPRFKGGFASNLATSVTQLVLISVILWLSSRDKRKAGDESEKVLDHKKSSIAVV
jgi:ACS family pantothenate transporter-like MFS transporter